MYRSVLTLASAALVSACAPLPLQSPPVLPSEPVVTDAAPDAVNAAPWLIDRAGLKSHINAHPALRAVAMEDGALLIRLPAAEGFATGQSEPAAPLQALLGDIFPLLQSVPETDLLVLGHTDSIGSELYNLRLSIDRAEAVMEVLRSLGVSLARLTADGRGEAEPIADNATPEGRAINRRVEIVVRPRD